MIREASFCPGSETQPHDLPEVQRGSDADPQFERDRFKACRQINKWAWCLDMLLDSDTDRQAQSRGMVSPACAFQEGLFGKAGPEAPVPDGGPPSHAHFALRGRIWGAAPGLHSTRALLHRHPCPCQRCHLPPSTAQSLFIVAFPRSVWVCTGGLSRFPG